MRAPIAILKIRQGHTNTKGQRGEFKIRPAKFLSVTILNY